MNVTHDFVETEEVVIPRINDEELLRRHSLFQLVIKDDDANVEQFRKVDMHPREGKTQIYMLRGMSCIWDPRFLQQPPVVIDGTATKPVKFYVVCGYYGFYKPSVAEVLSTIDPNEIQALGFDSYYIDGHVDILKSGEYQIGTAHFFRAKEKLDEFVDP